MAIRPHAQIRLFIPDGLLISRVLTYQKVSEALTAIREHNVWKVEVDGHSPMTATEFTKYCYGQSIDEPAVKRS